MNSFGLYIYQWMKQKYEKLHHKVEEEYPYLIELESGEVVNIKGFSNAQLTNKIQTSLYTYQNLPFLAFIKNFTRFGNLIFYFVFFFFIILYNKEMRYEQAILFASPLIIQYFIFTAKEYYYDSFKKKDDHKVNERQVTIFRRLKKMMIDQKDAQSVVQNEEEKQSREKRNSQIKNKMQNSHMVKSKRLEQVVLFENTKWNNIEVGDIIYLKKNELAPADLLLLNINDNQCQIECSNTNGHNNYLGKKPCDLTKLQKNQNRNLSGFDYKKILTGQIKYNINRENFQIKGFIKLKKDPKGENFGELNIIRREQKLEDTQFAYGIVLFSGQQCWCYQNKRISKKSFFGEKAKMFLGLTFVNCIIISFITFLSAVIRNCYNEYEFLRYYYNFLFFLFYNLQLLPLYFYLILDLIEFLNAYYQNKNYQNQIVKQQQNDFDNKIPINYQNLNGLSISDLIMSEYICFDKSGTLTTQEFKVSQLFIENKAFKFNNDNLSNPIFKKQSIIINEEDEDEEIHKSKQIYQPQKQLKMFISGSTPLKQYASKRESLLLNPVGISQMEQDEQINEANNLQQNSDDNIVENLKLEDIDDSHLKAKEEFKLRPKPFFSKDQILYNNNDSNSLQFNSSVQSPVYNSIDFKQGALIKQLEQKQNTNKLRSNSESMKQSQKFLNQFKNKDEEIFYFNEYEFYNLLKNQREIYLEAMLSLTLCHLTRSKYMNMEDNLINEYNSSDDQTLINFSALLGIKFICVNNHHDKIIYILEINEQIYEFEILAYLYQTQFHQKLGVLVQFPQQLAKEFGYCTEQFSQQFDMPINQQKPTSMLILRQESPQIPHNVEMDKYSREYWEKLIKEMRYSGVRPIIYSKKYLTEKAKMEFLEQNEKLRQQNENIESKVFTELYEKLEKDLSIIQIIGIEETLTPQVTQTIQNLKDANLKTWVLSGDSVHKVIPVAYNCQILDSYNQLILFDNIDLSEIKLTIKNLLQQMNLNLKEMKQKPQINKGDFELINENSEHHSINRTKSLKNANYSQKTEIKNYSISINGECFEMIKNQENLYNHFCFILYFSQCVIGYNLTPHQKSDMINIIQKKFIGGPKVIAVGDAYNDIQMLQQSDIAIQLKKKIKIVKKYEFIQRQQSKLKSALIQNKKFLENPVRKIFKYDEIWIMQSADILISSISDLVGLLFLEARLWAEIYDDLLVLASYRSLLLIYFVFLFQILTCDDQVSVYDTLWIIFYQSIYLLFLQIGSIYLKLKKNKDSLDILKYQFRSNIKIFKKKKVLSFLFKINGNALLDAQILFILAFIYYNHMEDPFSGKIMDFVQLKAFIIQTILAYDLIKYLNASECSLKIGLSLFFSYIIFTTVIFLILYPPEMWQFVFPIFQNHIALIQILVILLLGLSLSRFIEECLSSLLNQSLIRDENIFSQVLKYSTKKSNENRRIHLLIKKISIIAGKLFQTKEQLDIAIQQMMSGSNKKITQDSINQWTLKFSTKDTELKYKRLLKQNWMKFDQKKHFIALLLLEGFLLIFYFIRTQEYSYFLLFITFSLIVQIILSFIILSNKYLKHFFTINLAIAFTRFLCKSLYDILSYGQTYPSVNDILITQTFTAVISFSRVHLPLMTIIMSILQTVFFIIRFSGFIIDNVNYIQIYRQLNGDTLVITTCLIVSFLQYKISYLEREDFMLESTLNQETQQINNVLSILIPKFIRERIEQEKESSYEFQENQENISILFCDICNFDQIISVENEKVLNLLDKLFRAFDQLCVQNGLQKVETVGKTYMAAGGLVGTDAKFKNQNSVKLAVQLAFEMQDFVSHFKFGNIGSIRIKIGIHIGRVIAGVIGYHKPQFSLIGDTVNTTSRVCSTGMDGEITISEQAYEQINQFEKEYHFFLIQVEAKGKGILNTYQVSTKQKVQRISKRKAKPIIRNEPIYEESENQIQLKQISSEEINQIQRTRKRGPTLLQGAQNSSISIYKKQGSFQRSNFLPSQQNLQELENKNNIKINDDETVTEKQNIISSLEARLRREVQFELIDECPEYETDLDKVKQQFMNDEGEFKDDMGTLVLDPKQLYLDFNKTDKTQQLLKQQFYQKIANQGYKHTQVILFATFLIFSIKSSSQLLIPQFISAVFIIRMITTTLLLMFCFLQTKKWKDKFYKETYFLVLYILLILSNQFEFILLDYDLLVEVQAGEGVLLLSLFCSLQIIEIRKKFYILGISILVEAFICGIKFMKYEIIYFMILQVLIEFGLQFVFFYGQVNTFNRTIHLERKKFQTNNLLMYLLPTHILGQFLSNQQRTFLVDQFEEATLLFADIAGFTSYSSARQPETVVNMLRNLFTEFDKKCLFRNVYKLYTIGDCYVVLGIADASQRNPAEEAKNVIEMGFEMIQIIKDVRTQIKFDGLDMRIGIHTGQIIGGILGTDIVRYDVYGQDVMISNKMESNGEKGKIQVSEETKNLIQQAFPDDYKFIMNKEIQFKSIGRKTVGYFVEQSEQSLNNVQDELEILAAHSEKDQVSIRL